MTAAGNAIKHLLSIDAIVQEHVGDKVYPDEAPQSATLPFVIYGEQSSETIKSLDNLTGTNATNYEINVIAGTREETRTIANAIFSRLSEYSGTIAGVTVQWVTIGDQYEDTVTLEMDDGTSRYARRKVIPCLVWHNRE